MSEIFCMFDYSLTKINRMKYKIYTLNCPKTNSVRYVGVTTQSLNSRYAQHLHSGRKRVSTVCSKWINSLIKQGLKPTIVLLEECDEQVWEEREKYYIQLFKDNGFNLTNLHEGGKGIIKNRSKSSIERSSESKYIPVYQCDDDYNIIALWDSTKIAADVLGISRKSIYKCVEQRLNSNPRAGGYRWVHKDLYDKNSFIRKPLMLKGNRKDVHNVYQKTLNGELIHTFPTVVDFVKYTGLTDRVVRNRLSKGRFIYNNFIFEIAKKI